jgi:hypothetical protein
VKYQLLIAALAVAFVLVASALGPHRRGALVGATVSGATALASILALGRTARGTKPLKRALAVITATFLVRIALVSAGVLLVQRAGESIVGFVVAFFVPYFIFAAVEGLYVHSLNRGTGPTA